VRRPNAFCTFTSSSFGLLADKTRLTAFMMQSKTSRYGFIDAIRGIAACLVLLQHSLYQSGFLGDKSRGELTGFIPNWLELGETGVVAFFLVSGFVIPLSLERTRDFGLFWIHRALRIYPLYIAVFAVTILVKQGGDIHSIRGWLLDGLSHIFFLQEYLGQEEFVGGSWTLSLEMVWYIAITVLALVYLNKRPNVLVCLSLLISVFAQIACAFGHHLPMGRLSMLVCCVFGLVCYRREQGDISDRNFFVLFVLLTFIIALNLFVGFKLFPSANPSASFKTAIDSWALAAVIFFIPFFMRQIALWNHSTLSFLGRISYSIYLLHGIILMLLIRLHGIGLIVVAFAVTLGLSTLSYRFIELPPIRFGHSLKRVRGALPPTSKTVDADRAS
jgi:peptidoglycan/LPS O-acetylase OafA/YrhL